MIPAIALGVVAALELLVFAGLFRWQARAHTRERNTWTSERTSLVATLCHLSDRPLPARGWDSSHEPFEPAAPERELPPIADPDQLPK